MFNLFQPGGYVLDVNAELPWIPEDESVRKTTTFRRSLSFKVGYTDPERLARIMDALVAQAFDGKRSYAHRQTAIQALFSMPQSVGLPVWRSLLVPRAAENAYFVIGTAIRELVRLGTPTAADLLAEIAWGPYSDARPPAVTPEAPGIAYVSPPSTLTVAAQTGLLDMLRAGNPRIKTHVVDLFAAHEGAVP